MKTNNIMVKPKILFMTLLLFLVYFSMVNNTISILDNGNEKKSDIENNSLNENYFSSRQSKSEDNFHTTKYDILGNNLESKNLMRPLKSIASTSHPLSKDKVTLINLDEIIFLGTDSDGADLNGWAFDDELNSFGQLKHWDANDNTKNPNVATGDIDGDGLDEIVFLGTDSDGTDLNGWAFDDAQHNFAELKRWDANDNTKNPSLALGDIDGDLIDEIIFLGTDSDGADLNGWAFDDALHNFAELKHWNANDNTANPKVATGDIDGDSIDEIVFLGTDSDGADLNAWAFDDALSNFAELKRWDANDNTKNPSLALGDIDGDLIDEIIFLGTDSDGADLNGWAFDDSSTDFMEIKRWDANDNTKNPNVATGDIDGDGIDEIVFLGTDSDGTDLNGWAFDDAQHSYAELKHWDANDNTANPSLALGDIDADGKDEIIFLGTDSDGADLNGWAFDDSTGNFAELKHWDANDNTKNPMVITGEIDGDGVTVEYQRHYTTSSEENVIAVLASPPVQDGINQNSAGSFSKYGKTVSEGTTNGHAFTLGLSVGRSFSLGDPFGGRIAEASVTVKLSYEYKKTETTTDIVKTGQAYQSGPNENTVVFYNVLYDNYEYEIISHPDSTKIGQKFTLDVPNEPVISKWDFDTYRNLNTQGPNVDNVFDHIIGQVATYPKVNTRDSIASNENRWDAGPAGIGAGTGKTILSIELSTEETSTVSHTWGLEFAFEGKIAGNGYSATVSGSRSSISSVSVGSSSSFTGAVGDIVSSDFSAYHYNFGVFVYNLDLQSSINPSSYTPTYVMNYWVQDLGPGYTVIPDIPFDYQGGDISDWNLRTSSRNELVATSTTAYMHETSSGYSSPRQGLAYQDISLSQWTGKEIRLDFRIRATSNYAYSSVTNFYIGLTTEPNSGFNIHGHFEYRLSNFNGDGFISGKDSGWKTRSIVIPASSLSNSGLSPGSGKMQLMWGFSDAWSSYWNQKVELDYVTITEVPSFGEAVDNIGPDWTTSGNANWFSQESTYFYDNDAVQGGSITHSQSTSFQAVISFSDITFVWKISSEANYDFLTFFIDGVQKDRISGEVGWQQKSYYVPSGTHTVEWRYSKDGSVNRGSDTAWVDAVSFS